MERLKLGEIAWTDLQVIDMEQQTAFYESLFGWTHADMPTGEGFPDYRMFYKDGVIVAGGNHMSPDMKATGAPSFWAVYIATPDVDATAAKAVALGATVIMPAMDVLDSGRMVAIADPTGGGVFFWQARNHKGAESFGEPGTISWADLSTRDPQAAADFFTELLGWEITTMGDPIPYWQFSVAGEGQGGIMAMPEMMGPDARPFWTIYFGVDGIESGVARAEELGATTMSTPVEIGGGVAFAVLSDPAGAAFALLGPVAG
jgi:predicted enzyme related to lactoylglutathione lyase